MERLEPLVRQAQEGSEQAFEQLLERCYERIYHYALKWCGDPHNAEDITHQACIKLGAGLRQYRFEAAFTTWLYRLVINCARDWQKSQQRHQHEDIDVHQPVFNTPSSNPAEAQLQLQQVLKQIAALGSGYRETVTLVFGEGLSHAQAAEILEVKESTISWRIHDIRKRLDPQIEGGSCHA